MLSDTKIINERDKGEIFITPFNRKCLGSNSYDLHIADKIKSIKPPSVVDLTQNYSQYIEKTLPANIYPGEIWVFCSKEIIGCKTHTYGLLSQRSNLARCGLIFQFSMLLDTGFKGVVSGLIYNPTNSMYIIPKDLRVMQIMFGNVEGIITQKYSEREWSKNTGQQDISAVDYKQDKEWDGKVEV